jgi:hypothetical protein
MHGSSESQKAPQMLPSAVLDPGVLVIVRGVVMKSLQYNMETD